MAITAEEIRNYPLSTDRRGYNIDEVDQLLENVADSIDELMAEVAGLRRQLETRPTAVAETPQVNEEAVAAQVARVRADFERQAAALVQDSKAKDARIVELEGAVAEAKADGNAIAQALIIAQRSADEILTNANGQAVQIIADAKDDAANILARAEEDKQLVEDQIATLKIEREGARLAYQDLLKDFISDATGKLADLSSDATPGVHTKAAAPAAEVDGTARVMSKAQIPVRQVSAETYVTPQTGNVIPVAAMPTPSKVSKDLSGFGDADSDFSFSDVD